MSDLVRHKLLRVIPVLGVVLGFGASALAAESLVIQRKYDPKRVNYLESKADITQKIKMPNMPNGGEMEIKIKQVFNIRENVEEGKLGKKAVKLTFDRAMQSMDSPMMGTMEYDTDDPDNEEWAPQLGQIFQPMIGETLMVEVTRDGKVVKFSGMDAIAKKISEKAVGNMFWQQMKGRYTDQRARREYGEDPLRMYPNKEVKVGESWEVVSEDEDPQLGLVIRKTRYTLEKIGTEDGRKVAVISSQTDISKGEGGEGDAAKAKVSGKATGKSLYDVDLGIVVRNETESDMKIKMAAQGNMMDINVLSSGVSRLMTEAERQKQKEEMAAKIAERKKAEEAEEEEDEDEDTDEIDDDDDEDDSDDSE